VESCLQGKICENLNAEVASGTVSSSHDALGYLAWTFFARRVKANPSYYGAKSAGDDDVEEFLFEVVKDTLAQLYESGCIVTQLADEDASVAPTPLGIAAASYYLGHCTPKQMMFGVREGRRIILSCLNEEQKESESNLQTSALCALERSTRVDEIACAWLLYTLCSTHEFDEHPVRHNEELLNEELSDTLMWGPDTSVLLSGRRGHNVAIFQDPHTKCFLLLQAYLERAKLPITDYVNDTMSVVDNVPRLLAAMEFVACQEQEQPGSFELLTQFSRTQQYMATRSIPQSSFILGLPGVSEAMAQQILKSQQGQELSLRELRAMPRGAAIDTLSRLTRVKKKELDAAVNALYRLPRVDVKSSAVTQQVSKATGQSVGKLELKLEIERQNDRTGGTSHNELSLTLLVGTYQQKMLLGQSSIRLNRFGKYDVARTIEFDWNRANADGGEEGGRMIVRLLFDKVRGLDAEMKVRLT
jgi:hypothetical protein